MGFKENLRQKIAEKNITARALANISGVSEHSLKNWKLGYNYPGSRELVLISRVLGCTMDELMEGEE